MSSERVAVPARIVRAIGISINGLRTAVRLEEAFRLELLVLILVIPAAWILTSVGIQRALLDRQLAACDDCGNHQFSN